MMHGEQSSHLWGGIHVLVSQDLISLLPPLLTFVLHYYKAQESKKENILVPQISQGMYTSS
jgi:hypothetical protein